MCKATFNKPLNDVPLFSILFRPLLFIIKPLWDVLCSIRWLLSRPMNMAVLPFCTMPLIYPFKYIPHFTIGEVLFLAPIVVLVYLSYESSFANPNIEESGGKAEIAMIGVFLTANRSNSLITFIFGIPFERLVKWHKLWGFLALATATMHMWCAYAIANRRRILGDSEDEESNDGGSPTFYSLNGPSPNFIKYLTETDINFSGTIALIAMIALVVPSIFSIFRRWFFELWYFPHVISALVALIFALVHKAGNVVLVLIWWGVDIATRYILMSGCLYPNTATLKNLPGGIVELSFPKPGSFEYDAGQFVMVALPKLGFAAFHPFTISSHPHQEYVTMHIKALGKWTQRLQALALTKMTNVSIMIEGPYSSLAVNINDRKRYKMVMLVSGGIGVTPMYSIGNDLLHQIVHDDRNLKKMKFVWCIRSMDLLHSFQEVGAINSGVKVFDQVTGVSSDVLNLDVYLTNKKYRDIENHHDYPEVKMGRPDFEKIFKEMHDDALKEQESAVAVLACGPSPLMDTVRDSCRRWSSACGGVKFDFHEETFEL